MSHSGTNSYGSCLSKSGSNSYSLYVIAGTNSNSIQSIDGSSGNPYDNIYDALTRAMELCASYLSCTVTIYLESTTHGFVRTYYGFYLPSRSDRNQQTTKIILDKWGAARPVVNYKMRDKFRFLVGGGLEIRNIIFNAIDSVLVPSTDPGSCLSTKTSNCCGTSGTSLTGCSYARQPYSYTLTLLEM